MVNFNQTKLDGKVLAFIRDRGLIEKGDIIYVALSGGPDSVCLFDILFSLKEKIDFELRACHFDHRVRGADSEKDKNFVIQLCKKYGVPLEISVRTDKQTIKNENDARILRYAWFEKILKTGRGVKIALGHQANDTAETFLFRIFRGSGLKGLSSILPRRGNFIRPLLSFAREEIMDYLKARHLKYRTDKTNLLPVYSRNKIRLNIVPKLAELNPNIIETLAMEAYSLSVDYDYIRQQAEGLKRKFKFLDDGYALEREEFQKHHVSLQRESLRLILEEYDIANDVTEDHINKCINLISKGYGGKTLVLPHSLRLTLKGGKINLFRKNTLN